MTPLQRQQIFDKLMESVPEAETIGTTARREMEEITCYDLDAIEPLIDEMLVEAFNAGKRFADRKTEDDIVKPREVVIAL
jgi:hypothetical protein